MSEHRIIVFEPDTHAYAVDGNVRRSVTQVLEDAGISDWSGAPPEILGPAQERGRAVHACCHFINKRNLDPDTVDERIGGYVEAYKSFRRDHNFRPRLSEHIVYRRIAITGADVVRPRESDLHIVGTLDAEGSIAKWGDLVVDIKTGDETDAWRVQLAAYVRSLDRRAPFTHKRLVVKLDRSGSYRLFWYSMADFGRDFARFRLALIDGKRRELAA